MVWKPNLVVLIACEGAPIARPGELGGLARTIVDHNIQVVAMQLEITNEAAFDFHALYAGLAASEPIDVAVQQA